MMEATGIQALRDHISNTDSTAIKYYKRYFKSGRKTNILKQYHMWRTSLCVRTGDRGTHSQLIHKTINQLVGGMPLVAHISRTTEEPSALTLRVEVKEPTEDEKHSGSDHPQQHNTIIKCENSTFFCFWSCGVWCFREIVCSCVKQKIVTMSK